MDGAEHPVAMRLELTPIGLDDSLEGTLVAAAGGLQVARLGLGLSVGFHGSHNL